MRAVAPLAVLLFFMGAVSAGAQPAGYQTFFVRVSNPAAWASTIPHELRMVPLPAGQDVQHLLRPRMQVLEADGRVAHELPAEYASFIDAPAGGAGTRRWGNIVWVGPEHVSERTLTLRLAFGKAEPRPLGIKPIRVTETDKEIVVENKFYQVRHSREKPGSLIKSISISGRKAVFDNFAMNDRVYRADIGGFLLRNDPNATIQVVRKTPLLAQIVIRARYTRPDGQATPSNADAAYTFTYFAGTPIVKVTAVMGQEEPFDWSELHFIEINFPDKSFPRWAIGEPLRTGQFEGKKTSSGRGRWACVRDDKSAVGIIGINSIVYDGMGGYGNYVHGPWVSWSGTRQHFEGYLWLGPADDELSGLRAASRSISEQQRITVTTPELEDTLNAIVAEGDGLSADAVPDVQGAQDVQQALLRRAWWARDLLVSQLRDGRAALEAQKSAVAVLGALQIARAKWKVGDIPGATKAGNAPELLGNHLFITDEHLGIAFDAPKRGAGVISLRNLETGQEFAAPPTLGLPPWKLAVDTGTSKGIEVDAGPANVTAHSASEINIEWKKLAGPEQTALDGLTVSCHVRIENASAQWRLSLVDADGRYSIREIRFPVIPLGVLDETGEDDVLAVPHGWGRQLRNPVVSGGAYNRRYPSGGMTMQYAAYYDPAGGLYFGVHDPNAWTKAAAFGPTEGGYVASWIHYPQDIGKPGNARDLPYPCVTALTGDWYDASKMYRQWALKQKWASAGPEAARPGTPQALKDVALWLLGSGAPTNVLEQANRFGDFFGVPRAIHWYSWHRIPFDVNYPNYFPPKEGFKDTVAELKQAGFLVMPYINGRLWDTGADNFEADGFPGAAKKESGDNYIEVYGSGAKLAPMCPYTKLWQNRVADIVERLVGEYGVSGVYIDQVGAAAPALCFDANHGHALGGGGHWAEGYRKMLSDIRRRIKKDNPDAFLTTESNAEPYLDLFDAYLMCNSTGPDLVPMFPAVYSDRILTFGRYASTSRDAGAKLPFRMKEGQLFAFGAQVGWLDAGIVDRPTEAGFLLRLAQLREQARDFLAYGEMLRPLTPRVELPTVTADWNMWGDPATTTLPAIVNSVWRAPDARIAGFFVNVSLQDQRFAGRITAREYDLDDQLALVLEELGGEENVRTRRVRPGIYEFDVDIPVGEARAFLLRQTPQ